MVVARLLAPVHVPPAPGTVVGLGWRARLEPGHDGTKIWETGHEKTTWQRRQATTGGVGLGGSVATMTAITILDGGMGRELARIGAPFRQPEWSALAMFESPAHVSLVHDQYVRAGADVITTNAYALVPFHIGDERFVSDGLRLATLAGQLARAAADARPGVRVAGCLPPVLGSYAPELFTADAARPLLDVLVEGQAPAVDVWLAETQSSIAEIELVREVLDAHGSTLPLWVSFTVEDAADRAAGEPVIRSGESVADAVRAAERLGAELVSFNCSQPEVMEPAVRAARAVTALPIGVYANSFVMAESGPEASANAGMHELRSDVTPEAYAELAQRWIDAGATMVGGCCGIGAEHVSALSAHRRAS